MERLLHDPDYLPKSLGVSAAKNRAKKAIAGKKQEREEPKAQNAPRPTRRKSAAAVSRSSQASSASRWRSAGSGISWYSNLSTSSR